MFGNHRIEHSDGREAPCAGLLRRDDGSLTILGLFVFIGMLMIAGIAVDMMRIEHERVRMQGATDRAVLAATMLRQNVSNATPEQIVTMFMEAEGLGAQLGGRIQTHEMPGGRTVTVAPGATIPSTFMRLVGVNDIRVATSAQAVEAIGRVRLEVVMVLDVSGSMNSFNRIQNLRIAAEELVEALMRDAEPGTIAVTLVPYETNVIPPPGLKTHFINLPPILSGTVPLCVDFTDWSSVRNGRSAAVIHRTCPASPARQIRPLLHDADQAIAAIRGLTAGGTTSIDLGIRMGALFLDEDFRPYVNQMISNGAIDSRMVGRPFRRDEPLVVRAMIVMTDGENCCFGRIDSRHPSRAAQDAATVAVCQALRQENVTIYAVAFEAPTAGAAMMRACASSENHYFNTTGTGIINAFNAIASHMQTQALRLVR